MKQKEYFIYLKRTLRIIQILIITSQHLLDFIYKTRGCSGERVPAGCEHSYELNVIGGEVTEELRCYEFAEVRSGKVDLV